MAKRNSAAEVTAMSCPTDIVNGYVIAEIGGRRCLIDTGSPVTVSSHPVFELFGTKFKTVPTFGPASTELIGDSVGTRVDYLIGLNVLTEFPWEINLEEGWIAFYPDGLPGSITKRGYEMNCGSFFGAPVLDFELNGQQLKGTLDTGAPIQYAPQDADLGPVFDYEEDFFPTVGTFFASRHKAAFKVGNRIIDGFFGKFPPDSPLNILNNWILGFDVLKSGPLGFDPRHGRRKIYLA